MTRYLCKLKPNPYKCTAGTLAGVSFLRHVEKPEFETIPDPKTGRETRKFTGQRWLEEPVFELSDAQVEEVKRRLPHAVIRPGAGVVKLDANWGHRDPQTGKAGEKFTRGRSEGDLPLEEFIEFRPWEGPTSEEAADLKAENEKLRKEIEELRRRAEADEAEEAEAEAKAAAIGGPRRTVGPRRK